MTRKAKGQSESGKTINRMSDLSKAKIITEYSNNADTYNGKPLSAQVDLLIKNLGPIEYLTKGSLANTAKVCGIKVGREPRVYKKNINPAQQSLELIDSLTSEEIKVIREIIAKHKKAEFNAFG